MSKEIVPVAFCAVINMLDNSSEIHYMPSARFIQGILGYEGGDPIKRLYSDEDWERFDALHGAHMLTALFRKSALPEVDSNSYRKVYVKGVEDPKLDLDEDEYRSLKRSVMDNKVSPFYESEIYEWFGKSPVNNPDGAEKDEYKQAYEDFISGVPLREGRLLMEFAMSELSQLFTTIKVDIDHFGTRVRLTDRLTKKKYTLRKESEFCRSFASHIEYMEEIAKSMNAVASIDFDNSK